MSDASIRVLGRAETFEESAAIDADDPIVAARAVRRALAAAGRRAADVEVMVIATPEPASAEHARRFARRALGPIGASIPTRCLTAADASAEALALETIRALEASGALETVRAPASVESGGPREATTLAPRRTVAVVVGFGLNGGCVALCLGRGSGLRDPRRGSTAQRAHRQADEGATQEQRDGPDPA